MRAAGFCHQCATRFFDLLGELARGMIVKEAKQAFDEPVCPIG